MKLFWSLRALSDFEQLLQYIAVESPSAAQNLCDQIVNSVDKLERFPKLGRVVPEFSQEKVRELIVRKYRIVYRISKTEIEIMTVFNSRRNIDKL